MSPTRTLEVHRLHEGRLLRIVLAQPKANILTQEMMGELVQVLEREGHDAALTAITLEGKGAHFSFGASVEEHTRERVGRMLPEFHALFHHLLAPGVPLVALVRGQCLGGGFELAAICDFVFAEAGACFGVPEIKLGVFPPVACALLPARLGSVRANELLLTGSVWSPETARDAGLVTQVSPSGALGDSFATWFEEHLLPLSASSLRFATRAARLGWSRRFRQDLSELEPLYLEELMATHDAEEGIRAFLEKRPPAWDHGANP